MRNRFIISRGIRWLAAGAMSVVMASTCFNGVVFGETNLSSGVTGVIGSFGIAREGQMALQSASDTPTAQSEDRIPCGDLWISGGVKDTDFKYENHLITILTETPLTIGGTSESKYITGPYNPGWSDVDHILVKSGISANITFSSLNINMIHNSKQTAPFKIADGSTGNVNITLEGTNTLTSDSFHAGLEKNGSTGGTLTIKGNGSLTANGGRDAAGIGGSSGNSTCNIAINGGEVKAKGGTSSAGIGGGSQGNAENIKITGGNVTATGGSWGAGIGGGYYGSAVGINIEGGIVDATGGQDAAGIGGGDGNKNVSVTISGGTVTATAGTGKNGSPVGIGHGGRSKGTNTFICDGNAVIYTDSIGDQSKKNDWNGIIFGLDDAPVNEGTVYGGVLIEKDFVVTDGQTLTIPEGASLVVEAGVSVKTEGSGVIVNNGIIVLRKNENGEKGSVDDATITGSGSKQEGANIGGIIMVPTDLVYIPGKDYTDEIKDGIKVKDAQGNVVETSNDWVMEVTKETEIQYKVTFTHKTTREDVITYVKINPANTELNIIEPTEGNRNYTYGDTITIKATADVAGQTSEAASEVTQLTGSAFTMASGDEPTAPTSGQMALYYNNTQISQAVSKGEDGVYTITLNSIEVIKAGATYGEETTLTLKFAGTECMKATEKSVVITIAPCNHTDPNSDYICDHCGTKAVATVSIDGGEDVIYYSVKEAVQAADGKTATITLINDSTEPSTVEIKDGNITFIGGEHTFTTGFTAFEVTGGRLTIESGNIKEGNGYGLSVKDGTVEIKGGSFSSIKVQNGTIGDLLPEGYTYRNTSDTNNHLKSR